MAKAIWSSRLSATTEWRYLPSLLKHFPGASGGPIQLQGSSGVERSGSRIANALDLLEDLRWAGFNTDGFSPPLLSAALT
jgi:hypothetical protein